MGDPLAASLAFALCDVDDAAASLIIDDLLEAGVSVEEVCLDHLAPAARRLGDLWDRDRLPFTEVALATSRIQAMLRRMPASRVTPDNAGVKGAVFASVPGEQHTLGVMMAADLFRRNGWEVGLFVGLGHDELTARLRRDDRPVIGLSCSGAHSYPALRRLLATLAKTRPDAQILLSGHIVKDTVKISSLPGRVTIVPDTVAAEAEMARFEALMSQPRCRATSAA